MILSVQDCFHDDYLFDLLTCLHINHVLPAGTTNPYQANYKPLRLAGTARLIPPRDSTSFMGPVFIGTASIVGPDLGAPPQTGVFCTKHFADMRLAEANPWSVVSVKFSMTKCEPRMSDVARYPAEDVLGLSFYDLIHSIDLPQVESAFRNCECKISKKADNADDPPHTSARARPVLDSSIQTACQRGRLLLASNQVD